MPKLFGHSSPKKNSWRKNLDAGTVAGMEPQRPDSKEATSSRLRQLRYSIAGDNQTRFAAQLGIEPKRWNNLERNSPLSKDVALKIVQMFHGITLDWLFLGKDEGLSVQRHREITAAGKALTSPDRSARAAG